MYTRELPDSLKRFAKIRDEDREHGFEYIQSKVTHAAQQYLDNELYDHFSCLVKSASPVPEFLAAISPKMIAQGAKGCLDARRFGCFSSNIVASIWRSPEKVEAIIPYVTKATSTILDSRNYNALSELVKAVGPSSRLFAAVSTSVTRVAQTHLNRKHYCNFSNLVSGITRAAPELLPAVRPSARLEFLSSRETGYFDNVLIAFPKDGVSPVELSSGCKQIIGLKTLQDHWAGKDNRQVIWNQVVTVLKNVAADPQNPSAPVAQRELRAIGLG